MNDLYTIVFKKRANRSEWAKIKNKKIPCVFAVLCYSLSMKEKAPQKAQLWAVGNKVYRVIRNEGDKTHVHHHGEMALFYTRHLKMATPSQVAEYLGK
jgi:hypothetical protein